MKRRVVLVHGLWYGKAAMTLLARRLTAQGFECHCFGYSTLRRGLAANTRALHQYALGLGGRQLHFVGHSLGGLLILHLFDQFRDLPPGRVVLLGSPVRGSVVARQAADFRLTRGLIGRARKALDAGFERAPAGRETGVIAGTRGLGLGLLFDGLVRPHDGTISVSETRLPGAADIIEMPASHSSLVLSAPVARAVADFLKDGRFRHQAPDHGGTAA